MERSNRIAQAYGYAVCFIAVVTLLFSSKSIIDASFDFSAPIRADRYVGLNLTSFDAYKRGRIERGTHTRPGPVPQGTIAGPGGTDSASTSPFPRLSDAELRRLYDDERADHVSNVRFRAMRSLVSSIIMVVIALVLFATHWRWLRRESAGG